MVSIKDVAKLAGVSIATVSRTINNKDRVNKATRARVHRAIEKTGFSPNALAQNFRRGRTNFILVVLPSIGDPFFAGIVKGIQSDRAAEGLQRAVQRDPDELGRVHQHAGLAPGRCSPGDRTRSLSRPQVYFRLNESCRK